MDNKEVDKRVIRKVKWQYWLSLLLIPLAAVIPLCAEDAQKETVGSEVCCCELAADLHCQAEAQKAREMRPLSNLFIIGGILLGVAVLVWEGLFFYYRIWRNLDVKWRRLSGVLVGVASLYVLILLLSMLLWYITHTDSYYEYQPWASLWSWNVLDYWG